MIQFKRGKYNLDKLLSYTEYGNSKVFQVILPDELRLGRNEIKLKVNSNILVKGSDVFIDILNSEQNPIFYKISSIANEDLTRTIVVYVYDNTPVGKATIYISGTLKEDQSTYLFVTNINISGLINIQPVKFETKPTIVYKERLEAVSEFTNQRTLTNIYSSGSQTISLVSRTIPKNIDRDILEIERPELTSIAKNNQVNNNTGTSIFHEVPKYTDNSILTSKNFVFSASMKGGTIYMNNIVLPVPSEATSSSPFSNIQFSASILDVINTSSIEIFPSFRKTIEYQTKNSETKKFSFDRFYNHSNFTASFYQIVNLSSSFTTQSYAQLDLYDIEPEVGNLKNIRVSYKPLGVFGNNFQPIGTFEVGKFNVLSDSGSVYFDNELGLVEQPIGHFRNGQSDFNLHWMTQSFGTGSIVVSESKLVTDGIRVAFTTTRSKGTDSISEFVIIKPFSSFYVNKNTELELSLSTVSETDYSHSIAQMDVYISGSDISIFDEIKGGDQRIIRSGSMLGNYLGTITQKFGALQKNSFNFINRTSNNLKPIFVIQSGVWNFGNIELNARNEPGFSPNQNRIYVPLNNVNSKTELSLKVEYENENSDVGTWNTILDRVYYKGFDDTKQQLLLNIGSSSVQTFIQEQAIEATPTTENPIIFVFDAFRDRFGQIYTGSQYAVGMIIDVNTVFFGVTGSVSSSLNSYVWSMTSQARASVTNFDNFGQPLFYDAIHISGSSNFTLGTYGPGGATVTGKPNLDSWLKTSGFQGNGNGGFAITYRINPTGSSSGPWLVSSTSTCRVQKYEIKF